MSAAPPTTEVDICNLALARLGQDPITSIESPTTKAEDTCALHYPMTRRALLRGPRVYNFAKKYAQITVDATVTPAFGFANAYRLPIDFLRLLALGDVTVNGDVPAQLFDIVGLHIFTNQQDDDDTVNIYYIKDETVVALWDAIFVKLIRLELAKDMAYAFTLKPSLIKQLDEELYDVRLEAGAVAGQEKPPRRIQRSRFRDNRRMGGSFRDPTRYSV
jgi:hypothetical protein